ncbi:FHA domain-containing protein [Spirulina major]|uniref:FHA domain-containing protein n=1 Tax=Spirulina major TaxID=270636 RepID=UPI000934447A|nr:FHA domain-containing protein [Spirulina major]
MIAITLLHPSQSTPVQSWIFERESVVTVGRGSQNDIVLYSAVVSRRHAVLECKDDQWTLSNHGTNGIMVNGHLLATTVNITDGMVIRFGESGPKLRIQLGAVKSEMLGKVIKRRSLTPKAVKHLDIDTNIKNKLKTPKQDKSTFLE